MVTRADEVLVVVDSAKEVELVTIPPWDKVTETGGVAQG
jgi:hypothetical protein